jgi:hypothetical protein
MKQQQRIIAEFVHLIFKGKLSQNYKEFAEIDNSATRELVDSVVRVLHECLPCT